MSIFSNSETESFIGEDNAPLPGALNNISNSEPPRFSSGIDNSPENGAIDMDQFPAGAPELDNILLPAAGPAILKSESAETEPSNDSEEKDLLTGELIQKRNTNTDRVGNNRSNARNLGLLIEEKKFIEFVGKSDRQDFYEFRVREKTDITATLDGLDGNADLFLLNQKGKVIEKSTNGGKKAEEIERTLNAGTYYIRVRSKNKNVNANYNLSLASKDEKVDPGFHPTEIHIKLKDPDSFTPNRIKNLVNNKGFSTQSVGKIVHQGDPDRKHPVHDWQVIEVEAGTDLEALKEKLLADSRIEAVEFNHNISIEAKTNDTDFSELWGLHNTGQTGGTKNADINAPQAWNTQMGSKNVVVAVIDTGVDYEHPDLADNMWTNSGETAGNSKDDDGNGFVDDVYGYNWLDSNGDPMDDHSHGTHVAGIVGAVGDNNLGVTGVSPTVSIMALRFMGANGSGTTSDVAEAITYAADNGADIINASFTGTNSSTVMEQAIDYASDAGVLFVAAAGNSGEDNDAIPNYPASYDIANILAVAATDSNDLLADFSNYGATSVDMAAPGESILSTTLDDDYEYKSGTSMATPHVAGAAAVLLAQKPNLSVKRLRNLLKDRGRKLNSLEDKTATGRRLRLNTSLNVIS